MLTHLLSLLVFIPILGFIACVLTPARWERTVFYVSTVTIFTELVTFLALVYKWLVGGAMPIATHTGTLYASRPYTLAADFYFDKLAAAFFAMTAITTILIFMFSKFYMHREQGFKRFYSTVLLFFIGLVFIILAGNFEMLFIGWEFIGISSVLLIAFYRDRFLPARNALKVFSVYRIADAFLLAAILYAHHIFESNINFANFSQLVAEHGNHLAVLGSLLFVTALIKSAQFPFSYWLPRAMEGPTTSSAIFYGALSVHMGLFLLLRTYPLWQGSTGLRIAIALIGLITAFVAASIARVQSSIKTQIAYASITQIGIMFIELAAGLHWLVVLHFVSNAALRAYQLLISPSVVSYLVHDQFFYFVPPIHKVKNTLVGKAHAALYVLGIKEWSMNTFASHYIWESFKSIGKAAAFLDNPSRQVATLALLLSAVALTVWGSPTSIALRNLSIASAFISVLFYARAFTTKKSAATSWNLIMLGHLFMSYFLMAASGNNWIYLAMYGAGVVPAFAIGHACLRYLSINNQETTLQQYQGSIYAFTKVGNLFFVVSLLFMAFPISSSFLAQEILLSTIPGSHTLQIILFCFAYLLVGVSVMRLYTKLFFGSHKASYHEQAYKSS